jgi:hypothetical protein
LQAEKEESLQQAPLQPQGTNPKDQNVLDSERNELLRLRSEVGQLRGASQEAIKLRADLQRLRTENQQLRSTAAAANTSAPAPSDQFPKESWNFAGYGTPDAALVSAIWAMKEGNPKTYLESLSPEEQARMGKVWENKSEAEIAAKHQSDVSSITGMRVLDRKSISPEEVQMSVYIQGVDRMEKVSMKLINQEWKFGGFIRDPKK